MSVDSGAGRGASGSEPPRLACSLCDDRVERTDLLVLQCYPEDDASPPAVAAPDGFVPVCPNCDGDVDELVAAWTGHDRPPVGAGRTIGEGYRDVADDCSFCDRPLDEGALLGVEYYRPADAAGTGRLEGAGPPERGAGDGEAAYANHSLCGNCRPVFDEFLSGLRDEGSA